MTRILYVECRDGRPALNEEGFGYCCESLTGVDDEADNWLPYVPAAELESAEGLIECLKADRDNFYQERNAARERLAQERADNLKAEDAAIARAEKAEVERDKAQDAVDEAIKLGEKWKRKAKAAAAKTKAVRDSYANTAMGQVMHDRDSVVADLCRATGAWAEEGAELKLRVLHAEQRAERAEAALEERESDMHLRIRASYDTTIADSWKAKLEEAEARVRELENRYEPTEDVVNPPTGRPGQGIES